MFDALICDAFGDAAFRVLDDLYKYLLFFEWIKWFYLNKTHI